MVLAGCQQSGPVKETRYSNATGQKELEAYMDSINPVLKRHADTTEEMNNAILHFQQQYSGQRNLTQVQLLADGSVHPYKGSFHVINAQVDPETGTIGLEASFPNPKEILRPGQFAKIRALAEVRENVILIP